MKYVVLISTLGPRFKRGDVVGLEDFPEVGADLSDEKAKKEAREKRIAHWLTKKVLRKATSEEEKHDKVHVDVNERSSVEDDLRVANERISMLERENNKLKEQVFNLDKELRAKEPVVSVEESPQYKKVIAEKDKVIDDLRKQLNKK